MLTFILIMVVTGGISLLAQGYVKQMFSRYSRVGAQGGYTGAQVAAQILRSSGIHDVSIREQQGMLYMPVEVVLMQCITSKTIMKETDWVYRQE